MKRKTHMLATDLDGTLVGDQEALRELLLYYDELPYDVALVYVTGRHLASTLSLIEAEDLPQPDILITDVGTAIYRDAQLVEEEEWKQQMQAEWQPERIIEMASAFPSLHRQSLPDNRRISFTFSPNDSTVHDFEKALVQAHIPHKMIISSNRDVDVLPEKSGKGKALNNVIERYAPEDVQVLVAGDSGNDLDMLTLGYPAVIVGNAQTELTAIDPHPRLYHAQKNCAKGIHEAWLHFYGS